MLTLTHSYPSPPPSLVSSAQQVALGNAVQVASFHPQYQFDGEPAHDVSHYTSRSPVPIVHLLLVEDVSKAIDAYGGPEATEAIWRQNQIKLRALTEPKVVAMLRTITDGALRSSE